MDVAVALILMILLGAGSLGLLVVWLGEPRASRWPFSSRGIDPIRGPQDRVAIHDAAEPFIEMPPHIKSHDEMVRWMTKELPKLTAEGH
jgi:hypothetical protein